MGTAQAIFAVERCSGATGSDVTESDVTGRDVNHVPCQKYVLHMLNRKLRNIRPSVAFWPEVTSVTWPEEALSGSMFCAYPAFSLAFFLVVVTWLPDVTKGHLTPSGFPWVCAYATGSSTTPVVTVGHLTPSEESMECSLRRPRPITIGNPTSYI
jgi:hypothetical protein